MIRLTTALISLLFLYLVYGFYLSQVSLEALPQALKSENPSGFYDYRGVINVHTELSLGSSRPQEVIEEAQAAGLDFLIITDVNQYEPLESLNAYNGNLLVVNEAEHSFLDSRILTLNERMFESPSEAQIQLTDLLSQQDPQARESILIMAHPFREGPTWTGSLPPGLDGIEIINPKSISSRAWRSSKLDVLYSLFVYPFNPRYAFLRLWKDPTDELSLWDQTNLQSKLIGFGGADASARAVPFTNYFLKFPSYQTSFEIVNNHVLLESELTGRFQSDKQKIYSALKSGRFYVSLDLLGNPKGFSATVETADKVYPMGSRIKWRPGLRLKASLPRLPRYYFEIVEIQNGVRNRISNSMEFDVPIESPGLYRVIVRVSPQLPLPDGTKWITWIYSNHFFVE